MTLTHGLSSAWTAGLALGLLSSAVARPVPAQQVVQTGEARVWHTVDLTFQGPLELGELWSPNPFLDFRLDVTFRHDSGLTMLVPGYFAADGDAGESGASLGNLWRVHFTPPLAGRWDWEASFLVGDRASVDATAAVTISPHGERGNFVVLASDDLPTQPRGRGMLRYVGDRYPRFAGTGEVWLEAGPNSPENLLAYRDFDGTVDMGGIVPNFLHDFAPHGVDFERLGGGATWRGGHGRNLLGALNYLADVGMNSIYVITLTRHGDGDDVWPWRDDDDPWRFDCSKLDQWNRVFTHATDRGIHLQLVLTETENEGYFEQRTGEPHFSDARRLYYREMVARFGHHLALTWNLGEENGWDDWSRTSYREPNTEAQRRDFAAYLTGLDPYRHPTVVHTYHGPKPGEDQDGIYGPLLDPQNLCRDLQGASLQGPFDPATSVRATSADVTRNNHAKVRYWVETSAAAGHPWVVGHHEQLPASRGTSVDGDRVDPGHDTSRQDVLWGTLMAGGVGVQYYFGYGYRSTSGCDVTAESFHTRADLWRQSKLALDFFRDHVPLGAGVECMDERVADSRAYCLGSIGSTYVVYLREGTPATGRLLHLGSDTGAYEIRWFDPRQGGDLQVGSRTGFSNGGVQDLGAPPTDPERDWVVLVRRGVDVPGSGCPGTLRPVSSGVAQLGGIVDVRLPGVPADSMPILVVGTAPTAPVDLPAPAVCAPHSSCRVDVQPVLSLVGLVEWRCVVPDDPALVGHSLRVQGALLQGPPLCVTVTGAIDLPFRR